MADFKDPNSRLARDHAARHAKRADPVQVDLHAELKASQPATAPVNVYVNGSAPAAEKAAAPAADAPHGSAVPKSKWARGFDLTKKWAGRGAVAVGLVALAGWAASYLPEETIQGSWLGRTVGAKGGGIEAGVKVSEQTQKAMEGNTSPLPPMRGADAAEELRNEIKAIARDPQLRKHFNLGADQADCVGSRYGAAMDASYTHNAGNYPALVTEFKDRVSAASVECGLTASQRGGVEPLFTNETNPTSFVGTLRPNMN